MAAAAIPNRIIIGGAGTSVPLLVLLEVLELELVELLEEVELEVLELVDELLELLVLDDTSPLEELDVLVTSPLELELEEDEEELELDEELELELETSPEVDVELLTSPEEEEVDVELTCPVEVDTSPVLVDVEVDVLTWPVEVETSPVELLTSPVDVVEVTEPVDELDELPPLLVLVEVDTSMSMSGISPPVVVVELTTTLPPLDPPPKKPPKKPPPKPPPYPPPYPPLGIERDPPPTTGAACGSGGTGTGAMTTRRMGGQTFSGSATAASGESKGTHSITRFGMTRAARTGGLGLARLIGAALICLTAWLL